MLETGSADKTGGKVTVKGLVVDAEGKPVAGARVRASKVSDDELFDPFALTVDLETDGQGRFEVRVRPGEYLACATKGMLTSDGAPWDVLRWKAEAARPAKEIRIPLRKGRGLRGIVVRKTDGTPVASAKVLLENGLPTVTDGQGRFEFAGVGFGEHTVGVFADGFGDGLVRGRTTEREAVEVRIELAPEYRVRGNATDEKGRPVPGALVAGRHDRDEKLVHSFRRRGITDKDGNYEIRGFSLGRRIETLEVSHHDFAPAQKPNVGAPANGDVLTVDFTLDEGFSVDGHVYGPDGKPVNGAVAECRLMHMVWANTDDKGFFRLNRLVLFDQTPIEVWAKGYAPAVQNTKAGKGADVPKLVFKLTRGHTVTGRIVDRQERPIAGATFHVRSDAFTICIDGHDDTHKTDKRGRYRIENLPAASVTADFHANGYSTLYWHPLILDRENVIVMDPEGVIKGKVVDETGKPVQAFNVKLDYSAQKSAPDEPRPWPSGEWMEHGKDCRSEDGTFTIPDLTSRTRLAVTVSADGYGPTRLDPVFVQPADWKDWPLVIKLAKGRSVTGEVLDAQSGKLVAQADVWLFASETALKRRFHFDEAIEQESDHWFSTRKVARTDSRGRFEFQSVGTALNVHLLARHADYAPEPLTYVDPARPIQIKLQRAGGIVGSVKGISGLDLRNARAKLEGGKFDFPEATIAPEGIFSFKGIPPGEYWVKAMKGDWVDPKSIKFVKRFDVNSRDVNVDFELPTARITGRVVSAKTGKPVADAHIVARRLGEPDSGASLALVTCQNRLDDLSRNVLYVMPSALGTNRAEGLKVTRRFGATACHEPPSGARSTTDASGRFELANLPSGTYFLKFSGKEDPLSNFLGGVTIEREGDTQHVEIRHGTRATLSFKVVDAETKQPIPDAAAHLHTADGFYLTSTVERLKKRHEVASLYPIGVDLPELVSTWESIQSDADGLVKLSGLQPGRYGVWVTKPGYVPRWSGPLTAQRWTWFASVPIVGLDRAGTLVLKPEPRLLDGLRLPCVIYRITDETGRAVFPGGEEGGTMGLVETGAARLFAENAKGYRIDVLAPGRYTMEWEIHTVLERIGHRDRIPPAACRGKTSFEIRKGEETPLALSK